MNAQASIEIILIIACIVSITSISVAAMDEIAKKAALQLEKNQIEGISGKIENDIKILQILGDKSTKKYSVQNNPEILAEPVCAIQSARFPPIKKEIQGIECLPANTIKTFVLSKISGKIILTGTQD